MYAIVGGQAGPFRDSGQHVVDALGGGGDLEAVGHFQQIGPGDAH